MKKGLKWPRRALSISLILLIGFTSTMGMRAYAATWDSIRPSTPAGLAASSVGQTSLTLSWQASWDNVGVKSYAVFKNYAYLTYTTATKCTITGLAPGTSYTFYVAAQDAAGNISYRSNVITVKTASASVTPAPTPTPTPQPAPAPQGKVVAGYYAAWAAYSGYTPSDIPAGNLTHILYAFANIDLTYKIQMGDATVDPSNFTELKALKAKYPNLKTLISVGGWDWSGRFSDMASTADRRQAFAQSVAAFLKQYGFDGVDLDWEYPVGGGLAGNSARAEDKTNFTLLLQQLRSALDAQGAADGKRYLLSIAGGADNSYVGHVQLGTLAQYLDFATVMTYDMHGSYDRYTDLNAPLYPSASQSPQEVWSVDQSVQAWTSAGFPKAKLVVGMPFNGYLYTGVTGGGSGLFKPYASTRQISYDQIVSGYLGKAGYTRYYASSGRTPWLFNGSTFISYEDSQSLAAKASYINANSLAGAGIWELSQNANGTLLQALRSNLK